METTICGPQRQIVRWGESGRGLVAAMVPPLTARPAAAQVSAFP